MAAQSLLHDIIFKLVFGRKGKEPILRPLLNALLQLSGPDKIDELTILNPISEKHFVDEKGTILDLLCRDANNRRYIVEVQVKSQAHYIARTVFYTADQIRSQLGPGESYDKLERLVVLSILDFELFPEQKDLQSINVLYDVQHQRQLTDLLEVHFLELKKFKEKQPAQLRTPFERWLHVLRFSQHYGSESWKLPETLQDEEGIQMAIDTMRETLADPEIQALIRAHEIAEHDKATALASAKQEGVQEGVQQGQDRKELEIAKNLLAGGLSPQQIIQMAGVRREIVEQLQASSG